jgi:AcrR family transcriptional regulator
LGWHRRVDVFARLTEKVDRCHPVPCYPRAVAATERHLRKDAERNRQRILAAASELFTAHGLGVTLNEIAHYTGVGVGTVYRHFPDREQLIEALFEERLEQTFDLLEEAIEDPDPWRGLVTFHERALELQARDRGLRELMLGAPGAPDRLAKVRARLRPLSARLVDRARAAGALRADCTPEDLGIVHLMLSAVIDAGREVAPEAWRRYFVILLQGLRAEPGPPEPLPVPAVSPPKLDRLLTGAWEERRPARS